MNERIQELAIMANPSSKEIYEADNWQYNCAAWDSNNLTKFAELIVKECMSMSDELKAQYFTNRKGTMDFDEKNIYAEGEAACDTLRYKMKKHFGVEE